VFSGEAYSSLNWVLNWSAGAMDVRWFIPDPIFRVIQAISC
jgi:hypothetical protein